MMMARTDAGSHRDQHDVAVPAGGAEPRLGPGRGVRVVLHHDLAAEALLDPLLQRLVAPGQVRARTAWWPGRCRRTRPRRARWPSTSWPASSSVTTSAMACSVRAGLAAGVDLFSLARIRPSSSTTPAATFVPPTSTPMASVTERFPRDLAICRRWRRCHPGPFGGLILILGFHGLLEGGEGILDHRGQDAARVGQAGAEAGAATRGPRGPPGRPGTTGTPAARWAAARWWPCPTRHRWPAAPGLSSA